MRSKTDVSAPIMVVRAHVPWYKRVLFSVIGLLLVALLAYGAYEAGRGTDKVNDGSVATNDPALEQILEASNCLEKYSETLCTQIADLVRQLQISNATRVDLAKQVKALDEENERLREDLSLFQRLISGNDEAADGELVIHRFSLEPSPIPGEYLYTLLLAQGGKRLKNFVGSLEFAVELKQDGEKKLISLVDENASKGFPVDFRYYHRLEKSFQVPTETVVESLQVRIFENGDSKPILTKTIQLPL
ncbi:DUF6776 family protein [Nitrosomonas mobilis]|uniref:Transmembrane protein n=1 Tax=Nitrosomonas mobilis TaxID=51642 RepID=A0A1G5SB77_9PROT|nr:DUF6776 family protein [Nitrosomonas mobilis]SCZ84426.1 conserved hypothetical protein [Nitrosomonas mobilis]